MANRAYLYTVNEELTRFRDVSEYPGEIPLFWFPGIENLVKDKTQFVSTAYFTE